MRFLRIISLLIGVLLLALPFTAAAAQDDDDQGENEGEVSEGCAAVDLTLEPANPTFSFVVYSFFEGDSIVVSLIGSGTDFSLLESGSVVVGPVPAGSSLEYIIPADGDYLFSIEVTDSLVGTEVAVSCTPAEQEDDGGGIVIPTDGNVTLCHYPPGNPANAHTITVGASAASTHIFGHGDTLGACPTSVETQHDDPDTGTSVIVIPITGEISVWGNCVGDACTSIGSIQVTQINIINTVIVIGGGTTTGGDDDQGEDEDEGDQGENEDENENDGTHYIVVNPGTVYQLVDDDPTDNMYVIIYYLHPDPADSSVGVFQINLYQNDTLINDNVLVFIDVNSNIVLWTTQAYWSEQADDQGENEDD